MTMIDQARRMAREDRRNARIDWWTTLGIWGSLAFSIVAWGILFLILLRLI